MRCERPIAISLDGVTDPIRTSKVLRHLGEDGKVYYNHRRSVFSGRSAYLVPCGKCFACKSRRKSQVTFRMDCERRFGHIVKNRDGSTSVKRFQHAFFVSLSYANDFLPHKWEFCDMRTGELIESLPYQEDPVLCPHHVRDFFKRFRRYYDVPFAYYLVGEYGDKECTWRPHYHLIFYSDLNWQETKDAFRHCWSVQCPKDKMSSSGHFVHHGRSYDTHRYSMGRIDVKSVNIRRMRYVAKYIVKDDDESKIVPKFAFISNGLGSGFLESQQARLVRASKSLYAFSVDGKKCSLPRYFTHRMFTKSELKELVDRYVDDQSAPIDVVPGSSDSRHWYRDYIHRTNIQYEAWKQNQRNPLLVYL